MNIADNNHNLANRIAYALANLEKNNKEIHAKMDWGNTSVSMSNRLRRAAGRCSYWRLQKRVELEFSASMFESLPESDKTDTVIHEMAHAIAFTLNMGKGHDATFKRICKLMGGSGDRLMAVEVGVVKRNLVKRWVCVKQSNPSKLYIRTAKQAETFRCVVRDSIILGCVQVDMNNKSLRWLSAVTNDVKTVNPLETAGYKLEG